MQEHLSHRFKKISYDALTIQIIKYTNDLETYKTHTYSTHTG